MVDLHTSSHNYFGAKNVITIINKNIFSHKTFSSNHLSRMKVAKVGLIMRFGPLKS